MRSYTFPRPDGIREPHRPAAIRGKAVAVEIDDVDIDRAERVALFENARAFVDERIDAAIDNFIRGNLPLRDACLGSPLAHEGRDFGIGNRAAIFVVLVPARAGFLAVPPHFAQAISGKRLPNSRLFQVSIFFANAPAHVEARKIADGQRPHGHAEFDKRFVDRFDACALFDQKDGLAHVWMEHAVADKTAAVADKHPNFPQLPRKLHAGSDHRLAGFFPSDDFEQAHDIRGAEKMSADHEFRPGCAGGDFVNVQGGCVAGENRSGFAQSIELGKNLLFQRHALEHRFDHHVDFLKSFIGERWPDQLQTFVHKLLREAAAIHRAGIICSYLGQALVERFLSFLLEQHRNPGIGEHHRDAAAHRAGAYHGDAIYGNRRGLFWHVRNLGHLALAKENMYQRLGLI